MTPEFTFNNDAVNITVRSLVDFLCRSGDVGGSSFGVTLREGELAHKRREDDSGRALTEYPLSLDLTVGSTPFHLTGRADVIIPSESEGEPDIIEEIKTVSSSFYGGTADIPAGHIAQAVIYAFMWCAEKGKKRAVVRISYVPKSIGRERRFECLFSYGELRAESVGILQDFLPWVSYFREREMLSERIKKLRFPYGRAREGQVDFMEAVMRAARRRARVMIEAPTGIGKTMAALFPAVKSVGAGYTDRIFYLTAKGSNAYTAEGASAELISRADGLLGITLVSRDKLCIMSKDIRLAGVTGCPGALVCARAKGHYERVNAALMSLVFGQHAHITPEVIKDAAKKHNVCPYELALEVSDFADIIICDYNYVFDAGSSLRRFFAQGDENTHKGERYMLLCDEAHNLAPRARDMFSASLTSPKIKVLLSLTDRDGELSDDELHEKLDFLLNKMSDIKVLCSDNAHLGDGGIRHGYYKSGEPFLDAATAAANAAASARTLLYRSRTANAKFRAALSEFVFSAGDFSDSAERFDRRYVAFAELRGEEIKLSHICLDASIALSETFSRFSSSVLFSATLEPPDYFARVLGLGSECETLKLPSPYDEENLEIIIADKVSTRFADRNASADTIAELVFAVAEAHTGNYICYLPSYKYLSLLRDKFEKLYGGKEIDVTAEERTAGGFDRKSFLSGFVPSPERSHVGFCVLGGAFSEGVDLSGDRLSGVIIVGVGLPGISSELNLLSDYYDGICERGHEFAYIFPGMNRVLQAAGRVIRSENDRGIVLLIDDRFASPQYISMLPPRKKRPYLIGNTSGLYRVLHDFWEKSK
ncbi:MAG: ATP-dependent DNA helicase [Clostridia bacterium]|nr:ATP-dependent DNA helicase [Clostridia bacterium]